jgi:hypothetical protein
MNPANISNSALVGQEWRFGSLLGGVVVAYTAKRRLAVAVRMDDSDEAWVCYCEFVEFARFADDQQTCRFTCQGTSYERPCRVIEPATPEQISAAADELWSLL